MNQKNLKNVLNLKGPHPLKNEYKQNLNISLIQHNILVGTLLGDAYLEPKGKKPNYRYVFNQKKEKKDYVQHIYQIFHDWCSKEPQTAKSGKNIRGDITEFYYIKTCTHPKFDLYANQFYKKNKKIVPMKLQDWINSQVLSYWFMDDGSKTNKAYILNTQNFSLNQQEYLVEILQKKFEIKISIHKDRSNYRLYIPTCSSEKFTNIIKPYILPSFEYKLISL